MAWDKEIVRELDDLPQKIRDAAISEFNLVEHRKQVDIIKAKMQDPRYWRPKWYKRLNPLRWRLVYR
ncbi:MAG: hypothetical protein ACW980_22470 [Promethearchaeota archaeon]|jgi:hypothetical protein